jgi:hypothetical protein
VEVRSANGGEGEADQKFALGQLGRFHAGDPTVWFSRSVKDHAGVLRVAGGSLKGGVGQRLGHLDVHEVRRRKSVKVSQKKLKVFSGKPELTTAFADAVGASLQGNHSQVGLGDPVVGKKGHFEPDERAPCQGPVGLSETR